MKIDYIEVKFELTDKENEQESFVMDKLAEQKLKELKITDSLNKLGYKLTDIDSDDCELRVIFTK